MAKDNDKGLYLPLKLDLDEWERELMAADADLKKAMRKMSTEIKDLKLRYEVEITGAEAAGDAQKAMALRTAELNQLFEVQKRKVEALNEAYVKSIRETGEDSKATEQLARSLAKEAIEMNKIQKQLNSGKESDVTRIMQEAKAKAESLNLKYEVKITGAEAAGKKFKSLQLETEKLNGLINIQKDKISQLNAAYNKSVQETGQMSKSSKELANTLQKETVELNKLQKQLNSTKAGTATKVSNLLENLSPEYAAAKASITQLTGSLGTLTAGGTAAAAALGGGAGGARGIGAVAGMNALDDTVQETAKEAAAAAESVFALRENFNLTTKEAEEFAGVMAIDGTNAEAVASAMRKLNKQLETAGEDGNLASKTLEKYGVSLRNADGSVKSMKDQVKALADGYQRAKEAGDDLNYVTNTLGAGGSQFTHLLNGFDDYVAAYEKIGKLQKIDYDQLHLLYQKQNELKEAMRQVAVAKGEQFTDDAIQRMDEEIERRKREIEFLEENKQKYKEISEGMKQWGRVIEAVNKAWDRLVLNVTSTVQWVAASLGGKVAKKIADALGLDEAIEKTSTLEEDLKKLMQEENRTKKKKPAEEPKVDEKAEKKKQEAQEKLNEALFNAQATEYEKELHRIEKERDAYIKAGADKLDADRLYAVQKEAIDKKYYDQLEAEQKKATEEAVKSYNEQLEAQKRMQQQAISDAENTLKNNVQLVRKMQKEQAMGGDWQSRVQAWQDRQYMKKSGIRESDIAGLQMFGVDLVKKMADSTSRLFGQFGQVQQQKETPPVTNNTTVNIDRPIITDENLINQLADRVADKIRPALSKVSGANSY